MEYGMWVDNDWKHRIITDRNTNIFKLYELYFSDIDPKRLHLTVEISDTEIPIEDFLKDYNKLKELERDINKILTYYEA